MESTCSFWTSVYSGPCSLCEALPTESSCQQQ